MFGMHGKIERFGWTGMYVFAEPETRTPAWGYTIGLAERSHHPELVIVGLDDCCVASLFDVLATRVTAGERLGDLPGGRVIVEGHACRDRSGAPEPLGDRSVQHVAPVLRRPRGRHSAEGSAAGVVAG
jgi:Domain of unknown function (DUF4262)